MHYALVRLDYCRLAGDHAEHVAFRAGTRTTLTADAVAHVDVRMLAARALGIHLAIGHGGTHVSIAAHLAALVNEAQALVDAAVSDHP